jgi:DNA-3-methyladenine glycosylase I
MNRCEWAFGSDEAMLRYHDEEWGVPSHEDRHLFEMLILEGAQAGLSWATILRKRSGYRSAFADFDVATVSRFGADDVERLMADGGIVRNRAKIEAAITNARCAIAVRGEFGTLDSYLWSFVQGSPIQNGRRSLAELPSETDESRAMSRDLKRRGFRFVGPTICYGFMQAVGMVNDHTVDCFRHGEVGLRVTS